MSKIRQDIPDSPAEIQFPPEGDLQPYVVFTQLKENGPFIYAGWLDAADEEMAVHFATEHYGQDQECTAIWVIPRPALAATGHLYPPTGTAGPKRWFQVFTQSVAGQQHTSSARVEAIHSAAALEAAKAGLKQPVHSIWVVEEESITATDPGELIWRYTDQSYRLARGYSQEVRAKWEKLRAEPDLKAYEKDDLEEAF